MQLIISSYVRPNVRSADREERPGRCQMRRRLGENPSGRRVGCRSPIPWGPRWGPGLEPAVRSSAPAARRAGKEPSWLIPSASAVPCPGPTRRFSFETGKLAPQSQGAVVASIGSTTVLTTANAAATCARASTSSPSPSTSRSGPTPPARSPARSSAGRAAHRGRHPHLPPHRPPAAPVVRRRLPQRDADRHHGHRRRPGEPARRAVDQRRLGGADDQRHPVRGPDRRRARRLHHRRRVDAAPDVRRVRRLGVRARRRRA